MSIVIKQDKNITEILFNCEIGCKFFFGECWLRESKFTLRFIIKEKVIVTVLILNFPMFVSHRIATGDIKLPSDSLKIYSEVKRYHLTICIA